MVLIILQVSCSYEFKTYCEGLKKEKKNAICELYYMSRFNNQHFTILKIQGEKFWNL